MTEIAWICSAPGDPGAARSLRHSLLDQDLDLLVQISDRIMAGEPLGSELFPTTMFFSPDVKGDVLLPDLFKGGGYWIVSGRCADVMRQFDLGSGNLHPVQICRSDNSIPIDGEFCCLNFGNVKRALLANDSMRLRPAPGGRWQISPVFCDEDIALSRTALVGPDIWIDPAMPLKFFMSDRLVRALKQTGADKGFEGFIPLRRCKISM